MNSTWTLSLNLRAVAMCRIFDSIIQHILNTEIGSILKDNYLKYFSFDPDKRINNFQWQFAKYGKFFT